MKKLFITFNKLPEFFLIATAFLLSLRTKQFMPIPVFHLADITVIIAMILFMMRAESRNFLAKQFKKLIPYWKPLLALLVFIIIGQTLSFWRFGANLFSSAVILDYSRMIINLGIFSFAALLVLKNHKLLKLISIAIVASFLIVLPVHFFSNQAMYFSGTRLSGLMENSIVFGAWLSVGMVLCMGFITSSERAWKKIILGIWLTILSSFLWWSGARAAWLSMIFAVILFLVILWKQKELMKLIKLLFIASIAFTAGYFLIGNNQAYNMSRGETLSFIKSRAIGLVATPDTYYQNRISDWRENMSEIYRFPLGFGFVDPKVKDKYPGYVSIFFESLVYGGIFGLVFFVIFLGKLAMKSIRRIKSEITDKSHYLKISWLIAGAVVFLNITAFNFLLVRALWFFLGVLVGMILHEESEEKLGI